MIKSLMYSTGIEKIRMTFLARIFHFSKNSLTKKKLSDLDSDFETEYDKIFKVTSIEENVCLDGAKKYIMRFEMMSIYIILLE